MLSTLAARILGCADDPPAIAARVRTELESPPPADWSPTNDDISYAVRQIILSGLRAVDDGDMNAGELAKMLQETSRYFFALAAVE